MHEMKIEMGPDGEPIVTKGRSIDDVAAFLKPDAEPPPYCFPTRANDGIEVVPGITVSQRLIEAAVEAASPGDTPLDHQAHYSDLKKRQLQLHEEVRQDLDAAHKFLQEMFERVENPPNPQEKYISFDAMPTPLQRVVKAYADAAAANKELAEAISALKSEPPVAS